MKRNNAIEPIPGLPERIRHFRNVVGYTMEDFAKQLGLSKNSILNYETGKAEPALSTLIKMAQLLDVSVLDILGVTEGYGKPRELKHVTLRRLQETVQKVNEAEGCNNTIAKKEVNAAVAIFTDILAENKNIINCPDVNKKIASFQQWVKEFDAALSGQKPSTFNMRGHVDIEGWLPYENIKLLRSWLDIFFKYITIGKKEGNFNDFCASIKDLKKEANKIIRKLEQNAGIQQMQSIKEVD